MEEQLQQKPSTDGDVCEKNTPYTRKNLTKDELKKAYAQIETLLDECEENQEELAYYTESAVTAFLNGESGVEKLMGVLKQQKTSEASVLTDIKACYRVLYLISEQMKAAK